MPSRLIQGLDSLDTCSQFSDSATLHTLTRVGGLQRAVYFSQSESNFNNFDTISYGNSSTCGCDADIKVNINLETKLNYNLQFVAKCGAHTEKVVKLPVSKYVQLLLCKSVPEHVCVSHATVKLIGIDFFNLFFFLSVYSDGLTNAQLHLSVQSNVQLWKKEQIALIRWSAVESIWAIWTRARKATENLSQ